MFNALKTNTASVVTDQIETFTPTGIKLKSGQELEADIIVTATGLKLIVAGGMQATVDGRAINFNQTMSYKGMMYSDVPNMASCFGYTNASWTLKCDLTCCEYVCRMLNYMDKTGAEIATPKGDPVRCRNCRGWISRQGYVQRALDVLPKQGASKPWKLYQNYALDMLTHCASAKVDDGTMKFEKAHPVAANATAPAAIAAGIVSGGVWDSAAAFRLPKMPPQPAVRSPGRTSTTLPFLRTRAGLVRRDCRTHAPASAILPPVASGDRQLAHFQEGRRQRRHRHQHLVAHRHEVGRAPEAPTHRPVQSRVRRVGGPSCWKREE